MSAKKQAANSLAIALMVLVVLVVMVVAVGILGSQHLNLVKSNLRSTTAVYAAEAGIAAALVELKANPGWSAGFQNVDDLEGEWDPRYSVSVTNNNLGGGVMTAPDGTEVPAGCVYLLATGTCQGVQPRRVAVMLTAGGGAFRYCIASSSGIVASGPMLVAGVDEAGEVADKPGHIAGNGDVTLNGPATRVTGDVKATGAVNRSPSGVEIEGQVQGQHSQVSLPSIPITSYDPGHDTAIVRKVEGISQGLEVDGLARCDGDLTVNTSGLRLENGLLFVDGDLVIRGGISGRGAVICTGDVTITGGSELSTTNLAAIVARGKVTLTAAGSGNHFRGLVYTETGMEASDLKLVGAFVHRSASSGGEMKLTNCDVTYDPEAVQFEWEIPGFGQGSGDPRNRSQLGDGVTAEDFFDRDTGHFDPARVDGQTVPLVFDGTPYHSVAEAAAAAEDSGEPLPREDGINYASWEEYFQKEHGRFRSMLTLMDQQYQTRPSPALLRGQFSLDLNQFLNTSDRMRVVFWRDL